MKIGDFVREIVRQSQPAYGSGSWATVTGFDETKRKASIRLEPHGKPFSDIRVSTPSESFNVPLETGTQVWVEMDGDAPACITGIFHSDINNPPTGVIMKRSWVMAAKLALFGYPMTLAVVPTLPSIGASARGDFVVVGQTETVAQTGAADRLYVCLQGTDLALHWVQVAIAP